MNSPKPDPPKATPLPSVSTLEDQLQRWIRLRDQLADVSARLEYLRLMLRLTRH